MAQSDIDEFTKNLDSINISQPESLWTATPKELYTPAWNTNPQYPQSPLPPQTKNPTSDPATNPNPKPKPNTEKGTWSAIPQEIQTKSWISNPYFEYLPVSRASINQEDFKQNEFKNQTEKSRSEENGKRINSNQNYGKWKSIPIEIETTAWKSTPFYEYRPELTKPVEIGPGQWNAIPPEIYSAAWITEPKYEYRPEKPETTIKNNYHVKETRRIEYTEPEVEQISHLKQRKPPEITVRTQNQVTPQSNPQTQRVTTPVNQTQTVTTQNQVTPQSNPQTQRVTTPVNQTQTVRTQNHVTTPANHITTFPPVVAGSPQSAFIQVFLWVLITGSILFFTIYFWSSLQ